MTGRKLAKYSSKSKFSLGRFHNEEFKDKRLAFERDRDRIIHSEAFRKLEYKTQVFLIHSADYYRTRLTHTLEVAQVSRAIARKLRLNEDLSEAIALAHDLGHTPFGHNGEHKLNKLMKEWGGFEHNLQSYRIVSFIEKRYPDFSGLNLTFETLEGLVKHSSKYDTPANFDLHKFNLHQNSTLEAQIIDIADEIAYNNHDIDDGLKSGLIDFDDLYSNVALWRMAVKRVTRKFKKLDRQILIHRSISHLIGILITDVVANTLVNLKKNSIFTLSDVRESKDRLVNYSDGIKKDNNELKSYLYNNLYTHHQLIIMKIKAEKVIETLFNAYTQYPKLLPKHCSEYIDKFGLQRAVADYISGFTDRYALEEYQKIV